jgi:hypothetical protein
MRNEQSWILPFFGSVPPFGTDKTQKYSRPAAGVIPPEENGSIPSAVAQRHLGSDVGREHRAGSKTILAFTAGS